MPSTASKLFFPQQALASCMFAAVYRDTRGAALSDKERINHFPASPLVSVTFVIHGELVLLQAQSDTGPACHGNQSLTCFVTGPSDLPVSSWSPGDVTALTIAVYHDAWLRLGGDPEFQTIPKVLWDAYERFAGASEIDRGWTGFCAELSGVWDELCPREWRNVWGVSDWAQATLSRTLLTGAGRSLRSVERRLKRMSGQTRRSLEFYSAFESLHQLAIQNPDLPLAEVALAAGYADQSHMGRAVRRATGFTPARLNTAIQTDESFWCYRLLGERF